MILSGIKIRSITPEQIFMLSVLVVNAGNYIYNLALGRILGPEQFSDAAILITFLLVLSFLAMTFQLTVAKFITNYSGSREDLFLNTMKIGALVISFLFGLGLIIFAGHLQDVFKTGSSTMFILFGFGIPIYFIMSINRGYYQGHKSFFMLSLTYQGEMISRLLITLLLLFIFKNNPSIIVATGILISLLVGLVPVKKSNFSLRKKIILENSELRRISKFIIITAFYEFTQIIINNSDILLVKHYFDPESAGLYASLALIGRVVYYVAWMFVMILLPTVVQMKKNGQDTTGVFLKYLAYICILALAITSITAIHPELIINIMFGKAYISIAPLLWKYALATSIFAVSNIFVYYFLSLDKFLPVVLSGIFGILQVASIVLFHRSLEQVVDVQIIIMIFLLIIQISFFFYHSKRKIHRQ